MLKISRSSSSMAQIVCIINIASTITTTNAAYTVPF